MWQILSAAIGEKVNRTNCRAVLEQLESSFFQTTSHLTQIQQKIDLDRNLNLEFPEGQVPLASSLYIQRDLEQICYQ